MINSAPVEHADEAGARAETMARFLRDVPVPFTRVLSLWVGYRLRRDPRQPDTRHRLTPRQACLLGLPPHTEVTRREGYLVPNLGDHGPQVFDRNGNDLAIQCGVDARRDLDHGVHAIRRDPADPARDRESARNARTRRRARPRSRRTRRSRRRR